MTSAVPPPPAPNGTVDAGGPATPPAGGRWHRDRYAAAVWESDLKPLERLVALAFADHARAQEFAYLTYRRVREVTGIKSDETVRATVVGLIDSGWLAVKDPARGRRPATYWISIPGCSTAPVEQRPSEYDRCATPPVEQQATTVPSCSTVPESCSTVPESCSTAAVDNHQEDHKEPPPPAAPPVLDGRVMVVVEALPSQLAVQLDRAVLEQQVTRLGPAWTAERLTEAARRRGWTNAGPGVVIRWLQGLPAQPPSVGSGRSAPEQCPHGMHGGQRIIGGGADASRVCARCEVDQPAADPTPVTWSSTTGAAADRWSA